MSHWLLMHADARHIPLPDSSVDAIVCDPPYGLEFMGKEWDRLDFAHLWSAECYRVLKPGGHLLAMGGSRTYHRLGCAVEDAGFEIRDCLTWLYASGFPKSLNLGNGWGTALKPAAEFICMARKPLIGTVAANVEKYGTGALNVDGCRIGTAGGGGNGLGSHFGQLGNTTPLHQHAEDRVGSIGRWPANVVLGCNCEDEHEPGCAVALLDEQSGNTISSGGQIVRQGIGFTKACGRSNSGSVSHERPQDSGGASRFYKVAKLNALCGLCGLEQAPKHAILNECETAQPVVASSSPDAEQVSIALGAAADSARPVNEANPASEAMSATIAAKPSETTPATDTEPTTTALSDAWDWPSELLAQRVRSAGNLCGRCTTAIAQSLVAMRQGHDPATPLGRASISEPSAQILRQSLALYVESLGSTDTIPTTQSLSLWFGYVRDAMRRSTPTGETDSESAPMRCLYQSKASRSEREAGLVGAVREQASTYGDIGPMDGNPRKVDTGHITRVRNHHPTVKPIALMRWLVRLVTPPDGLVLDPFTGSGTTGCACVLEGFRFIGLEREPEYVAIAQERIRHWLPKQLELGLL